MPLLAECPSCGKTYRVPHADRVWTCKECGELLVTSEDELRQHDVDADLQEGFRCLKRLEVITTVNLIYAAIFALLFVSLAALGSGFVEAVNRATDVETLNPGQPMSQRMRLQAVAVGVALIGLAWLGKTMILRAPVLVLVAMTLFNLWFAWFTGTRGDTRWESVIWTLFLAYATWQAVRFQGLLREHPESFVARRLQRRTSSPVLPGLVVGAAAVLGLGSFALSDEARLEGPITRAMPERPREPELVEGGSGQAKLALESFLEAWNERDFQRLASMGATKTARRNLAELAARPDLPRLEDVTHDEGTGWLRAEFTGPDGGVEVRYESFGVRWKVRGFSMR